MVTKARTRRHNAKSVEGKSNFHIYDMQFFCFCFCSFFLAPSNIYIYIYISKYCYPIVHIEHITTGSTTTTTTKKKKKKELG